MIGVKVTQKRYRLIEKRVKAHKMKDISQLARFVLEEEAMMAKLTSEDVKIIQERSEKAKGKIQQAAAKRKGKNNK
ncbi:MAG: hypothetical protein FWH21_01970 [Kiritimatiellaeota bacterium]|nr:hypothetical protein [Kiritimatiellota bacterium]